MNFVDNASTPRMVVGAAVYFWDPESWSHTCLGLREYPQANRVLAHMIYCYASLLLIFGLTESITGLSNLGSVWEIYPAGMPGGHRVSN